MLLLQKLKTLQSSASSAESAAASDVSLTRLTPEGATNSSVGSLETLHFAC